MYLLDTDVVSELRRPRPHPAVRAWIEAAPASTLRLSAVTLGELQAGVEITRARDPGKAAAIEAWVERVAEAFEVLPMNARAFRTWARLMHGRPDGLSEDAMIAATALVHGVTVVTRHVRDFRTLGIPTLNPFEPAGA